MQIPYSPPSALMTADDEVCDFDPSDPSPHQLQQQQQQLRGHAEPDSSASEEVNMLHPPYTEDAAGDSSRDDIGWAFTDEWMPHAADMGDEVQQEQQQQQQPQLHEQPQQQQEQQQQHFWEKPPKESAATWKASAAARFVLRMQAFVSRIISSNSNSLLDINSKSKQKESKVAQEKQHEVMMAFHQREHTSELLQYHFTILLLAVAVALGTQNALAPNLSRIAETFHFSEAERDIRVGGELAFLYYTPGCIGSIAVGLCTGLLDKNKLVSAVLLLAGLASLCTFFVTAYWQLALLRLAAGLASGGVHPLAYSWIGDWFTPSLRSCASALVLGAAGFGAFCGQCLAALLGAIDWRWVFLILAAPLLFMAQFYYIANGSLTQQQYQQHQQHQQHQQQHHHAYMHANHCNNSSRHLAGEDNSHSRGLNFSSLKAMARSKTNLLMLVQAFPGNVPWGVLVVYLHDFLQTDVGLSDSIAIAAIVAVAAASFCGMIVGGIIGGQLYAHSGRRLLRFCAFTCILRCIPCVMIFAFPAIVGRAPQGAALLGLLALLLGAAFVSTLSTANVGAVLLNVNTAEVRGTICAIYTVLDDISKALGTVLASVLAAFVGSRALAFQLSMSLWLLSAVALFAASTTYAADEARAVAAERKRESSGFCCLSDEGAHDRTPLILQQQQQQHLALHQETLAGGKCSCCCSPRETTLMHSNSLNSCSSTSCNSNDSCCCEQQTHSALQQTTWGSHTFSSSDSNSNLWAQIQEDGGYSRHLSRL